MVWFGMVWYGLVWFGMVWYGMLCCFGLMWYWYGMVWYGMEYYQNRTQAWSWHTTYKESGQVNNGVSCSV